MVSQCDGNNVVKLLFTFDWVFLACRIDYSWLIKGENKLLNKHNVLMNDSFQNRVIPLEKDYKRAFVQGISASCFHIQHTKGQEN